MARVGPQKLEFTFRISTSEEVESEEEGVLVRGEEVSLDAMFYDLNVPWTSNHAELQRTLAFSAERESNILLNGRF